MWDSEEGDASSCHELALAYLFKVNEKNLNGVSVYGICRLLFLSNKFLCKGKWEYAACQEAYRRCNSNVHVYQVKMITVI